MYCGGPHILLLFVTYPNRLHRLSVGRQQCFLWLVCMWQVLYGNCPVMESYISVHGSSNLVHGHLVLLFIVCGKIEQNEEGWDENKKFIKWWSENIEESKYWIISKINNSKAWHSYLFHPTMPLIQFPHLTIFYTNWKFINVLNH